MRSHSFALLGIVCSALAACKSGSDGGIITGTGGDGTGQGGQTGQGGAGGTPSGGTGGTPTNMDAAATMDGPFRASDAVLASPGCGTAAPTPTSMVGNTQYGRFTLTVPGQAPNATNRLYFVRLPQGYDPNRPYRVIYLGPGCGQLQDSVNVAETYNIETLSTTNAILVEMSQGNYNQAMYETRTCPTPGTDQCAYCFDDWAYRSAIPAGEGIEQAYFRLLHQAIENNYCVDKNRQFFTGYSSGGWLAQQLGCWFPDVLRAQGNVTGGLPPAINTNVMGANDYCMNHPISAVLIHDFVDPSNFFSGSVDGARRIFNLNGCTGTFAAPPAPNSTAPLPAGLAQYQFPGVTTTANFRCYQYTTCPTDYPIVFCVSIGVPHENTQAQQAIPVFWNFFNQF